MHMQSAGHVHAAPRSTVHDATIPRRMPVTSHQAGHTIELHRSHELHTGARVSKGRRDRTCSVGGTTPCNTRTNWFNRVHMSSSRSQFSWHSCGSSPSATRHSLDLKHWRFQLQETSFGTKTPQALSPSLPNTAVEVFRTLPRVVSGHMPPTKLPVPRANRRVFHCFNDPFSPRTLRWFIVSTRTTSKVWVCCTCWSVFLSPATCDVHCTLPCVRRKADGDPLLPESTPTAGERARKKKTALRLQTGCCSTRHRLH